ncbi:UNVERIFIED_CONTAM: hypothetical protein Q9R58_22200 [Methylobacteriaceae bacterium AG10]|nr:hypothetical protein [Methylobacteriaceae bacterium AG10]
MSPEQYATIVAIPTLADALAARGDRRLNYLACIAVFHVLDYVAATRFSGREAIRQGLDNLQAEVAAKAPTEFKVVHGVCNGTKHAGGYKGQWREPGAERDVRPVGFGPDTGGWGDRWTHPGLEVIEDGQKVYLDRAAQVVLLRTCEACGRELGAVDLSLLDADLRPPAT